MIRTGTAKPLLNQYDRMMMNSQKTHWKANAHNESEDHPKNVKPGIRKLNQAPSEGIVLHPRDKYFIF
jgi:hypothetical protein